MFCGVSAVASLPASRSLSVPHWPPNLVGSIPPSASLSPTPPADGDFLSPRLRDPWIHVSQSNFHSHIFACRVETWRRGSADCLPGLAPIYPEPIIIAAVARPSSDIKRLLNQQPIRPSVMQCQTKCPYHTALQHIVSSALDRETQTRNVFIYLHARRKCAKVD